MSCTEGFSVHVWWHNVSDIESMGWWTAGKWKLRVQLRCILLNPCLTTCSHHLCWAGTSSCIAMRFRESICLTLAWQFSFWRGQADDGPGLIHRLAVYEARTGTGEAVGKGNRWVPGRWHHPCQHLYSIGREVHISSRRWNIMQVEWGKDILYLLPAVTLSVALPFCRQWVGKQLHLSETTSLVTLQKKRLRWLFPAHFFLCCFLSFFFIKNNCFQPSCQFCWGTHQWIRDWMRPGTMQRTKLVSESLGWLKSVVRWWSRGNNSKIRGERNWAELSKGLLM